MYCVNWSSSCLVFALFAEANKERFRPLFLRRWLSKILAPKLGFLETVLFTEVPSELKRLLSD